MLNAFFFFWKNYSNEEGVGVGRRDSSRDFMTFLIIVIKYVYNIYIYLYKTNRFKKESFYFPFKNRNS